MLAKRGTPTVAELRVVITGIAGSRAKDDAAVVDRRYGDVTPLAISGRDVVVLEIGVKATVSELSIGLDAVVAGIHPGSSSEVDSTDSSHDVDIAVVLSSSSPATQTKLCLTPALG